MSLVQAVTHESLGASSSVGMSLTCTTGNTLVVHVTWGTDTLTDFASVTDGVNNAKWTVDKKVASGGHSQSQGGAYAINITGGTFTVQANLNNTPTFNAIIVEEHTATGAFDKSAIQTQASPGTGTDAVTSGATTAVSGDEVSGCTSDFSPGTDTWTKGTGFTDAGTIADSGNIEMHSEWRTGVVNQAGTFTATAGTSLYATDVMTFLAPAGGATGWGPLLGQERFRAVLHG